MRFQKTGLQTAVCVAGLMMAAGTLHAEGYVSSNGTTSGSSCPRTAPCRFISQAVASVNPGGVVVILDSTAGGSQAFIDKSITIRAEGVDGGSSTETPSINPWIAFFGGPNDTMTLIGLQFNGGGVSFESGGHLHVINSRFTNNGVAGASGISFNTSNASRLSVTDSVFVNQGSGTGGGIVVNPKAGGSARVNLERVIVNGNAFGIAADGSNSTAGINMTIKDSSIGGNSQDGIVATSAPGKAPVGVFITNSVSVNNAFGVRAIGSNVTVRLTDSKIIGNNTGLATASGGTILSSGNNAIQANGVNGAFTGSFALQ